MKLKKFIKNLEAFAKKHPEALEMTVVTAIDDEGNGFNEVYFTPILGFYEDREFMSVENMEEYERPPSDINAVCVN